MIYTGSSREGEDIRVARGAYTDPNDPTRWSSEPYPSQRREARLYNRLIDHIDGKRTVLEELELVKAGKSTMPRMLRDYIIKLCEETYQV